ncbi:MAG: excinuclease ABC subunit UvrA [Candidatus Campbellbacteria bacterium]|nr:excinuclease ABC subunit UvrA [Candidatus Campbellbacteria bacterium]
MKKPDSDKIIVKGARTHNLKNITVEMPRNKMVVFTGLSGSGKSSLAFDTIFAEGQRRYVESLSAYARQFISQMPKPDVDEIVGLSPAISIDQKSRSNNPRSTVATITEISDYLRILYARIGIPHCLVCGEPIKRLTNEEIQHFILEKIIKASAGLKKRTQKNLSEAITDAQGGPALEILSPIVRGRKGEYYQQLYDFLNRGYTEVLVDGVRKKLREQIILEKHKKHDIDILIDRIPLVDFVESKDNAVERLRESLERSLHEAQGLVRIVFSGIDEFTKKGTNDIGVLMSSKFSCPNDGYSYPEIEPRLFSFNSPYGACAECNGLGTQDFFVNDPCLVCNGARLRPEALHVRIHEKNIVELTALSVDDAHAFFVDLPLTEKEKEISNVVVREIIDRLKFMQNVGIGYLTLDRRANTLSGGEAQRIRLASQLGSGLVGALYVLDEPTIGLHAHDNDRLIRTLHNLRDLGNTVIIVEHDEDTIFSSDYIVDIGPGAGIHGGKIVVAGDLEELLTAKEPPVKGKSLTLAYLRGEKQIELPEMRRTADKGTIKIRGGNIFNIKNMNVDIPLGKFIVVTGVSGSGKSSFMYEILYKNLQARLERKYRTAQTFNCGSITGTEYVSRTIMIDQSPIGRTSRSNPATYTGAFTHIRDMFATTAEARARGWKASRFSFNVKGGRCEACEGKGEIAVEMHFLPTVYVGCDVCHGKRFMRETLEIEYRNKSIHDVLSMTVEEALAFFNDIPAIFDRLNTLNEVGLGYLQLGQSATTLSGGESQRVKISSELYRTHVQKTLYLLDEPTIGLHYEDVRKLIEILQMLTTKGNSVILIEHNMDIVKSADYIIDIGPDGGNEGGKVVAHGTPEEVADSGTHTGKYLHKALRKHKVQSTKSKE